MTTSSQARPNQRIAWVDAAKGIGIFLVVLGHTLRGLSDSGMVQRVGSLHAIDTWIYAFHMPLFFFLSGLFAPRANSKTVQRFVVEKVKTIAYPYFVWCFIIEGLRAASGENKHINLIGFITNYWRRIYQPVGIFWFLYTLFLISILYLLLSKLSVPSALIFFGSVFLYNMLFLRPEAFLWEPLEKIAIYSLYFVGGAVLSERVFNQELDKNSFLIIASLAGFGGVAVATVLNWTTSDNPNPIFAFIGIGACILLSKLLTKIRLTQFLNRWGALSLQIYVVHTAATSIIRIALSKAFHLDNLLIHTIVGTSAGIYIPILIYWCAERANFPYLFTLPRQALNRKQSYLKN